MVGACVSSCGITRPSLQHRRTQLSWASGSSIVCNTIVDRLGGELLLSLKGVPVCDGVRSGRAECGPSKIRRSSSVSTLGLALAPSRTTELDFIGNYQPEH